MSESPVSIALVGCGSLSRSIYLPLLCRSSIFNFTHVVDVNKILLSDLKKQYPQIGGHEDIDEIIGRVDAAIVATPNTSHFPIAEKLLSAGIHVLVEKPLAPTAPECLKLETLAADSHRVLSVGHVRRFYQNSIFLKQTIDKNSLGKLATVTLHEGYANHGLISADTFVNRAKSGGGVLMDLGPHILDLLIWWLGLPSKAGYSDDTHGGVEAECAIELQFDQVKAMVIISKLRNLSNQWVFCFDKGSITMGVAANSPIRMTLHDESVGPFVSDSAQKTLQAFDLQLADFHKAITSRSSPACGASEAANVATQITNLYLHRSVLKHPYEL